MPLPDVQRNFKGAVALANWIKKHHWYAANDPVNVAQGGLWPAFKNAVQAEKNKKEIVRYYLDYLSNISVCKEVETCYQILIPSSFNVCHRRFALCKELCHILTDADPYKEHDVFAQLNRALRTVRNVVNATGDGDLSPFFTSTDLDSEDFCFLLALEILIPVIKRDQIIIDVKVNGTKTAFTVATELRIPETLVWFFIDSSYNTFFKRVGGIECKP